MVNKLTVDEIRSNKKELEEKVLNLLIEFEKENYVNIDSISVDRLNVSTLCGDRYLLDKVKIYIDI